VALLLLVGIVAGCRPDTVRVSFRPAVGARYRYVIDVHSVTTTHIEGTKTQRRDERVRLVAEHTVLSRGSQGVRVRVVVGEPGKAPQSLVVRFDAAAQLESIESVEGDAPDIVGALGVPEIFPGAAGPPARPLSPGDDWSLNRRVYVPGTISASRVRILGRLDQLGVAGDEDVARVVSRTTLPLVTTAFTDAGLLHLDGAQRIDQRSVYDLDDGAVRSVRATTIGRFRLRVEPVGSPAPTEVPGRLDVRVTSTTKRLSS
jgi:hypothetical protein